MNPSPRQFARLSVAVLFAALLASPVVAGPRRSKVDDALRALPAKGARHRVIVQTRPGSRAAVKRALQQHGDVIRAEHADLGALTVELHAEDLAALELDPSVVAVSIDAEVTSFGWPRSRDRNTSRTPHGPFSRRPPYAGKPAPEQSGALRSMLGIASTRFTGEGINVAVVDSGLDAHKDLAANIAGFWDFTKGGIPARPRDEYGHGTHVAGLIASSGFESNRQFAGVAPGVRLYGFKVLDQHGRGRASDVVSALEFIVANKRSSDPRAFKIDVINLSLGHPVFEPAATDPLVRAVESAVRAGIVVITAAGNMGLGNDGTPGYAGITSPGNAPSAITVGALDTRKTLSVVDDRVASFSSRGPTWFDGFAKPDVVAPGVSLTSDAPPFASLYEDYPELRLYKNGGRGSYGTLSGTSMAAAVATGVASLVLEASRSANIGGPALTPNALKAVLQYSAYRLGGRTYDPLAQGTGAINAPGALALARAINTDMPAGTEWLRTRPQPYTTINGGVVAWSQAVIWDDNIVWGTDALMFNSAQWADNIVWGTAFDAADNIVWGTAAELDNIVWGTVATWSADLAWAQRVIGLMDGTDNIVWGTMAGLNEDNIVWGTFDGDNIVWGTWDGDNIVWGTLDLDNIVWGTLAIDLDNIVWGTLNQDGDNIVWGTGTGR